MTAEELNAWLSDNPSEVRPRFTCPDGFSLSVQASRFHYCHPREEKAPAYTHVEVGYPSEAVLLLMPYAEDKSDPKNTVYGWVPIETVASVLSEHGA